MRFLAGSAVPLKELEQIQFLLGHRSVETTERYLGCCQRLVSAVNDKIDIEPTAGGP
jgi:integrase